jgi:hypothetical protein
MAYTKYSLTPADNNAAPPNGAPEGMLPSAVNDTMRDMMAQIRDVGDGIRGGTYTMTAPVITGGSINGTTVGASTASTGAFTTLGASGVATFSAGSVSAPAITTTGDTNTGIFFPAADTIAFTEGGVESMRIDSSGNVGIGTNSPNGRLDLSTSATTNMNISAGGTGTSAILNLLAASGGGLEAIGYAQGLRFGTITGVNAAGFTERMRIDSSGNVGIGISDPNYPLNVLCNASNAVGVVIRNRSGNDFANLSFASNNGATVETGIVNARTGTNGAAMLFNRKPDGGAATEAMRVDSTGRLGINAQNSIWSVNERLSVQAIATGSIATFRAFIGASEMQIIFIGTGGALAGYIDVLASTTAYITSSDYRLKENVAPMTGALAKITKLKPVTYTWKADGTNGQGFIAHELQEVVPDCVRGEKDAVMQDGSIKPQGIDTSFLVATLTAAMQEQQAIIEELKAKVAALEAA